LYFVLRTEQVFVPTSRDYGSRRQVHELIPADGGIRDPASCGARSHRLRRDQGQDMAQRDLWVDDIREEIATLRQAQGDEDGGRRTHP
jgi:hypothetical protein